MVNLISAADNVYIQLATGSKIITAPFTESSQKIRVYEQVSEDVINNILTLQNNILDKINNKNIIDLILNNNGGGTYTYTQIP